MTTRLDPTRTTLLRKQFMADMRRRFVALRRAVWDLIVVEDALGLVPAKRLRFLQNQIWRFKTDPEKVGAFNNWLKAQTDQKILSTSASGEPWTAKYVDSAYRKGTVRAFVDARGEAVNAGLPFYEGSKAEFLRSAFAQPERLSKIKLLSTRTFEELKGVSATMAQQLNRELASGLAHGKNPGEIARVMSQRINSLSRSRALTIARTEVISAHAEGQLDSFEDLGVEDVGIMAEWSTAGDDRVCSLCAPLEGTVLPVSEARGLIPRHPNCRCAWIPADASQQKNPGKKAQKAIEESIQAERPKKTFAKARRQTVWAGVDVKTKKASAVQLAAKKKAQKEALVKAKKEAAEEQAKLAELKNLLEAKQKAEAAKKVAALKKLAKAKKAAAAKKVVEEKLAKQAAALKKAAKEAEKAAAEALAKAKIKKASTKPKPLKKPTHLAVMKQLMQEGATYEEIKLAFYKRYKGKVKSDAWVQSKMKIYMKQAQKEMNWTGVYHPKWSSSIPGTGYPDAPAWVPGAKTAKKAAKVATPPPKLAAVPEGDVSSWDYTGFTESQKIKVEDAFDAGFDKAVAKGGTFAEKKVAAKAEAAKAFNKIKGKLKAPPAPVKPPSASVVNPWKVGEDPGLLPNAIVLPQGPSTLGHTKAKTWMRKEFPKLSKADKAMTLEEVAAGGTYKGYEYREVNGALRKGKWEGQALTEKGTGVQKTIYNLDRMMARTSLDKDLVVYRGFSGSLQDQFVEGAVFTDKAYMSTSIRESVTGGFGGLRVEIHLPKGSKGQYLDFRKGANDGEAEYLLPRGSRLLVKEVLTDNRGRKTVKAVLLDG